MTEREWMRNIGPLIVLAILYALFNASVFAANSLKELEEASGGRLGVSAINTANHAEIQYRQNERFPFCSTFKVMGVAAILQESIERPNLLQQRIQYKQDDLVTYSPITEQHLRDGMSAAELCEATLTTNDIGIIYPLGCKPIVVTIYFTQGIKDAKPREEVIASATKIVIQEFSKNDLCLKKLLGH